jgi:hypothetical protein
MKTNGETTLEKITADNHSSFPSWRSLLIEEQKTLQVAVNGFLYFSTCLWDPHEHVPEDPMP